MYFLPKTLKPGYGPECNYAYRLTSGSTFQAFNADTTLKPQIIRLLPHKTYHKWSGDVHLGQGCHTGGRVPNTTHHTPLCGPRHVSFVLALGLSESRSL